MNLNEFAEVLAGALKEKKQTGSDYTATVTRVDGSTAYVQVDGSDIADTPAAMSVSCKAGDMVRVRVSNGKAWITGNDTAPPTDNTEVEQVITDLSAYVKKRLADSHGNYSRILQTVENIILEVGNKMDSDMGNKASTIEITQGLIKFLSNTIVIDSSNFSLDSNGNATFSGTLDAAGGTFNGKTNVYWHKDQGDEIVTKIGYGDYEGTYLQKPIMIVDGPNNTHSGGTYKKKILDLNQSQIRSETVYTDDSSSESYLASNIVTVMSYNSSGQFLKQGYLDVNGAHSTSDIRMKTDIGDIDPETAKRLCPVRFRFKDEEIVHHGFIAQSVQEIMPGAVSENDQGYLMLNYQELIAPLYALVQDQEKRITQLEKRLEALEDK